MIFILTSNAIVFSTCANAIYINDIGRLGVETPSGVMTIKDIPENALQQVAVALADGKNFVEFDEASLVMEEDA